MANNPQDLFSNWFQTAADLTEAALRATAQVQLNHLDRWMETMSGMARESEENNFSVPVIGDGNRNEQAEEEAGRQKSQQRGRSQETSRGKHRSESKSRSSQSRSSNKGRSRASSKSGSRAKSRSKAGGRR